jgi:hypothetical protein
VVEVVRHMSHDQFTFTGIAEGERSRG